MIIALFDSPAQVRGFTNLGANRMMFDCDGTQKSVAAYFEEKYNLKCAFCPPPPPPSLPRACVLGRSPFRRLYGDAMDKTLIISPLPLRLMNFCHAGCAPRAIVPLPVHQLFRPENICGNRNITVSCFKLVHAVLQVAHARGGVPQRGLQVAAELAAHGGVQYLPRPARQEA